MFHPIGNQHHQHVNVSCILISFNYVFKFLYLAKTCDDPQTYFNGYIESLLINNSSKYPINSIITFQCPSNMTLRGSRISKCQINGTWLPKTPRCES